MVQMQDLEGIVGRTSEGVRLNLEVNTTHHLATWALSNELTDHPVSDGGVVDSFFVSNAAPNGPCVNYVPPLFWRIRCLVAIVLVVGRRGFLSAPNSLALLVLVACGSHIAWKVHLAPLGEPPFQEHGTSRNLYPVGKVSIAVPSRSV